MAFPITSLIFRNYFANVPTELVEAARIDGAGLIQTFFQIMLPLSLPAFVVVGIFQFTNIWNDFLFGVTVVFNPADQPVTVALNNLNGTQLGRLDGCHGGRRAFGAADGAGLHPPRTILHPRPARRLDEGLRIRSDSMTRAHHADVVIVGSGMGGGTLAWALRDSGAKVLLLERGGFLPSEPENWSAASRLWREPVQGQGTVARRERRLVFAGSPLLRGWEHQGLRRGAAPVAERGFRRDPARGGRLAGLADFL